jgi:hypothetical protein
MRVRSFTLQNPAAGAAVLVDGRVREPVRLPVDVKHRAVDGGVDALVLELEQIGDGPIEVDLLGGEVDRLLPVSGVGRGAEHREHRVGHAGGDDHEDHQRDDDFDETDAGLV